MGKVSMYGRWAGVLVVVAAVVLATPSRASAQAQPNPDLGTIVPSQLPGYQIAPAGIGLQGPLTVEQLKDTPIDDARALTEFGPSYARTFRGPGVRTVVIIAIDAGSPQLARSASKKAPDAGGALGTTTPLVGFEDGIRIVWFPDKADGLSVHQAYFRSGRLLFTISVADSLAKPVTEADVLAIVAAQAAAVPPAVANPGPSPAEVESVGALIAERLAAREADVPAGRLVGYAVAVILEVIVVMLMIVMLNTRRRPAPAAPAGLAAPAPGWGPPPSAWGAPPQAPTATWTPPSPPAWPPPAD